MAGTIIATIITAQTDRNRTIPPMPLIAILRGVKPEEVTEIVGAIIDAGIRIVEIPLNSPEPLASLEKVTKRFSKAAIFGAGTVLTADDVRRVSDAGGEIIVSPNFDGGVVRESKRLGLMSVPGVMTPSEAFAAIDAGADVLKFFPGELLALSVIRAYAAVLPKHIPLVLVGGVTAASVAASRTLAALNFPAPEPRPHCVARTHVVRKRFSGSCKWPGKRKAPERGLPPWAVPGSNQRPPACKAGALPTELTARAGAPSGIRTRATALKGL